MKTSQPDKTLPIAVASLRIACALFSLIPASFNLIAPQDFLTLIPQQSSSYETQKLLFHASVITQFICSLCILIGFNVRLFAIPVLAFALPVQAYFVLFDQLSSLREIAVAGFLMAIGLHIALFFFGNGALALPVKYNDIIRDLSHWDKGVLRHQFYIAISPSGRNIGIIAIRIATALPLFVAVILWSAGEEATFLSPYHSLNILFAISALIAALSLVSGFMIRQSVWLVLILVSLNLVFVAIPEANTSQVGIINIELHILLILSLYIARFLDIGSVLERHHILNANKKKIVILGGGFAGTTLAKHLENIISSDYQVVLVNEENYTTFNPMLAEVIGASVIPSQVLAPIRRMLKRTVFVMGRAVAHDKKRATITCRTEKGDHLIDYEHLVFAIGSRANPDVIPGMSRYSYPLKLLGDALQIRNRVIAQLERLDRGRKDSEHAGVFIVVGGGFSGIEVAGALQDYFSDAVQFYPRVSASQLRIIVIHSGDLPLPELPAELGRHSLATMEKRGIEFHLRARVAEAFADRVLLKSGETIYGETIICTIGTCPNPLVAACRDMAQNKGRFVVAQDMRVQGCSNIWALGDCAFVPNAFDGELSPPTAQFAIAQGKHLAYNIQSALSGVATRAFGLRAKGMMAVIGNLNGVALVGGVKISGLVGWILWRCFYLSLMPTFSKKVRIAFEWIWSMLFSPDIINLRLTRSRDVDKQE